MREGGAEGKESQLRATRMERISFFKRFHCWAGFEIEPQAEIVGVMKL